MDYSLEEKSRFLLPAVISIVVILAVTGLILYRQEKSDSSVINLSEGLNQDEEVLTAQTKKLNNLNGLKLEHSPGDQLQGGYDLEVIPEFQQAETSPQEQQPLPQQKPQQEVQLPKSPCDGVICPDDYFCIEIDDKCVAQPISYCGDGICKESENRNTCSSDCVYVPMENEKAIFYGNVISIYDEQLGGEWQELKLKDSLRCISIIKDEFKIDLSEPAKTKMLILSLLVGEDEKTYSYVNAFGIVHVQNLKSYQSLLEDIDYLREKINEQGACLSFHEIMHVFLFSTPIPLWASEGLATYSDLEFNPSTIEVECRENTWYGTDSQGGSLEQPYSDLSKPAGQNEEPGIYWYYTANCFWKYIQQNYGNFAIIAILQELKRNEKNDSLDFLKDIVNKVLQEDIRVVTKQIFNIP